MTQSRPKKRGQILVQVIVFGAIAVYIASALVNWAVTNIRETSWAYDKERALQIAEVGVEYYRWHLAHAPTDFRDGTSQAGPYVHNFYDKDGNLIGHFSLNITPPPVGSSLVTVDSVGTVTTNAAVSRTIEAKLAKPSIAKYAVIANDVMRFGVGTEVFGLIHSNKGIHFDGLAHNLVTSAVASYTDPDYTGGPEFGVYTRVSPVDPLPPAAVPVRTDVFQVGRQFPVPAVDFGGITVDLAQMKSAAQANGFYAGDSGALGYHVLFKTNGTFDLYKVTSFVSAPQGCSSDQTGWGTWSIKNQQFIKNYPLPANGLIFLGDDVFVDGQINGARVTIIAALLPDNASDRKNIIVNNDLLYSNYDGSDALGLIAQNNVSIGMVSDDNLRIDAALIAQNGRVGRFYYYKDHCSPYGIRQTITLWGMIATNQRYGFAYDDGDGYVTRNLNYDGSLLYGPPPSFPLTSDQYVPLTWQEVK